MNITDIVFANLKRRRGKMLFLLLAIILATGTIVALFSLTTAMNTKVNDDFEEMGTMVLLLPPTQSKSFAFGGITVASGVTYGNKQLPYSTLNTLKENAKGLNIKNIAPKKIIAGQIQGQPVLIVGVDFNSEMQIKNWLKVAGQIPGDNGIILGKNVADKFKKQPGDFLVIDNEKYRVAGVLEKAGTQEDGVIMAPLALVQNLSGNNNLSLIELVVENSEQFTANVDTLKQIFSDSKVIPVQQVMEARKEVIKKYQHFAILVSLIIVLVAFLVVATTMIGSVNERVKEIGLLRSIGYGQRHIINIILLEASSICFTGGLLGYSFGTIAAKVAVPFMEQDGLVVGWQPLPALLMVLFSLVIGLLASWMPAVKAANIDPAEALRHL